MNAVALALAPIFLTIVVGWGIRVSRWLPDAFWPPMEKLIFFILFPALLVSNLAEARLEGLPVAELAGAHFIVTVVFTGLGVLARPVLARRPFSLDLPAFASALQGFIRPNTYVGLAAAAGIYGARGVTLTAICVALVIPLVNAIAVTTFALCIPAEGASGPRWRAVVLPVVKNPLILGCLLGMTLNATGIGLPGPVAPFLKILAQASLALGLLAVGAGLDMGGMARSGAVVLATAVVKLAALPAAVGWVAWEMGVRGLPLAACVLYGGLPCAPNAYMLARHMGGDHRLVASIITGQTVLAVLTLPVLVAVVGGL